MSRQVDEKVYYATLRRLNAVQDLDSAVNRPGDIGRIEQWRTADGAVCGWIHVAYWKGENDVQYHLADAVAPPG